MRHAVMVVIGSMLLCHAVFAEEKKSNEAASSVLEFTMNDIDGKAVPLSQYKGKVLLIVNTASKCGHTPQYAALEKVYDQYKEKGLVVLGFPANEFRGQEPGTNAQIKEFCTEKYGVSFPMFSKIVVKGDSIHPLYKFLTSKEANPDFGGEIAWNFSKFLVDREGKVVARFEPKVKPDEQKVIEKIEAELGEPAGK